MTQQQKLIEEGINYLRLLGNQTIKELADNLGDVSEERIKEAIKAARQHKDAAHKPPKMVMVEPQLKVHRDLRTGAYQSVREVKVELQKDIIIHYGEEAETEFFALLPIKITVKRV